MGSEEERKVNSPTKASIDTNAKRANLLCADEPVVDVVTSCLGSRHRRWKFALFDYDCATLLHSLKVSHNYWLHIRTLIRTRTGPLRLLWFPFGATASWLLDIGNRQTEIKLDFGKTAPSRIIRNQNTEKANVGKMTIHDGVQELRNFAAKILNRGIWGTYIK